MSGFEFFDYDAVTGITEYIAEEDGKIIFKQEQDCEPYIKVAKYLANTGLPDSNGTKFDARLYAIIPPVIQGELYRKGINMLDRNDDKKLLSEINTVYPWLKTTTMTHR